MAMSIEKRKIEFTCRAGFTAWQQDNPFTGYIFSVVDWGVYFVGTTF